MAEDTSALSGRVAWYLRKLWLGSQTRMAAETGITQAAISKVVLGRRNPGRRFLLAVAGHPLVNGAWLLSGIGEPLLQPGTEGAAGEPMLPLAQRLLPGPVDEHRHHLSGAFVPVLRSDFAASRYWYRVGDADQVEDRLIVGDWLLIETDGSWRRQPDGVRNEWCAIIPAPEAEPRLGWVKTCEAEKGVIVRAWSKPISPSTPPSTMPSNRPRRALLLNRRALPDADKAAAAEPVTRSPAEPNRAASAKREPAKPAAEGLLPIEAIVGLVVLQQRRGAWR